MKNGTDGKLIARIQVNNHFVLQSDLHWFCVWCAQDASIRVVNGTAVFESRYDRILPESTSQCEVFELVKNHMMLAVEGYNATVFA